jgi:hypothetical protein
MPYTRSGFCYALRWISVSILMYLQIMNMPHVAFPAQMSCVVIARVAGATEKRKGNISQN